MAAGCRVLTGGEGSVMEVAQRGARSAAGYREGDSMSVLRQGGGGGGGGGGRLSSGAAGRMSALPQVSG